MLIASSALLMEPYYAARTKAAFEELASRMTAAGNGGPSEIERAKSVAAGTGYKIAVADRQGTVRASSVPEFREGQTLPLPKEQIEVIDSRGASIAAGESFFGVVDNPAGGQSVIMLASRMGEDSFLVITQPLEELRRNIAAASPFFLGVGAFILVLALAAVLVFSARLSRPILELSEVARRVAAADFGARYSGSRDDELGVLGKSLNEMAEALSSSIEGLSSANLALEAKVKAQEAFIAGASHELKTPVGLVRGYAEAIKLGLCATEAERGELAEIILKEADHLDHLVGDLASIAASAGGGRTLSLEDTDLGLLLAEAADRFLLQAAEKGVSIRLERGPPLAIRVDAHKMVQVVDNLLSNAVRHVRDGGIVVVRAFGEDGEAVVEVENTGEPIPEEHLGNLFEPFYRADPSRSRSSGGTGLGLAVAKGFVTAHGGKCGARNAPGGPLFWFSVPLLSGGA